MTQFSATRISHPFWMFFISLFILSSFSQKAHAQSEVWAGGEILLEYNSGACDNDTIKYDVILKFYRDDIGTAQPLPQTKQVWIYSPDNGIPINNAFPINVNMIPGSAHGVNQYCLNGNPVATEGAWYRTPKPAALYSNKVDQNGARYYEGAWYFVYVGEFFGDYRSPEDRNINLGQQFWMETRFNLNCGFISGTTYDPNTNTYIPTTQYNNAPIFSPTEYVFDDPVGSFCVGKEYEWNMKAVPHPPHLTNFGISKVEFDIAPIWKGKNQLANYITSEGYSINNPFPNTQGIDETDLEDRGILRFTPSKEFAGPVPFFVRNYTQMWDTMPGDVNKELVLVNKMTVMTQREYRFIFDTDCNSRQPDFIGGVWVDPNNLGLFEFQDTYNPVEDAYEFDCATTEFVFQLTEPVLIESLGKQDIPYDQQDQGFRFGSFGVPGSDIFLDDIPVRMVENINVINVDETDLLRVTIDKEKGVGPGRYFLYMKKGDDLNTLVNRCESAIPEYDTLAEIVVNSNYTYNHREDEYTYCYPAGDPPEARISVSNPDYIGWKYYGGTRFFPPGSPGNDPADDTIFHDTTYLGPSRFKVDQPDNPAWYNSKIEIGAGWWAAGAGYDYSTFDAATGDLIEQRVCYDEDIFYVDTVTVDDAFIPDFDLCPDDDLPVISLDSLSNVIIQNSFQWGKWDGVTYKDFYSQFADPSFPAPNNVPDSTGKDYVDVSTKSYVFDTKGAFAGVGDTNFFRAKFRMRGKYLPNRTCPVQIEFKVLKQLVESELNEPKDSVICEGEQYLLRNIAGKKYFHPEKYSYRWFLDDVEIPNETDDSLMITTTGRYMLEVTKTTENMDCRDSTSVFVRVSQFLAAPEPACSTITFTDGQIEQLFAWNPVPDAQDYDVRIVLSGDDSGSDNTEYGPWEKANGLYGIMHSTFGPRLGVEVRAVNGGVDTEAVCRYSDTAYAAPCDAIVKATNVFTPNGDGINDFLSFDLVEVYPGSKLTVFNRWGKKVYDDNDYANDWDGDNLKEGTYFYVLDINADDQDLMKGTFTIIRD